MEHCDNVDNVDLLWNNHNSHLCSSVNNWRHCDDFADVTLVYENEKVEAHKVVLATFSPFFRRILLENPHPHPLVYLKGVSKTEMDGVLDFMYKGKVEVAVKDIDPLMKIFSEFEVVDCDRIENVPSRVGVQTKNSGQTQNSEQRESKGETKNSEQTKSKGQINSGQTKGKLWFAGKQVDLPAEDSSSELSISMESDNSGKDLDKTNQDSLIQESLADKKIESPPKVGSVMQTKRSNKRENMENLGFSTNKQLKIEILEFSSIDPNCSFSPTTWINEDTLNDMLIKSEPTTSLHEEITIKSEPIASFDEEFPEERPLEIDLDRDQQGMLGPDENGYIDDDDDGCYHEWKPLSDMDPDCSRTEHLIMMAEYPTRYKCTECGYESKAKFTVVNHIEAKHIHGTYPCTHCGKVYTNKVALTNHVKMKHYEEYYNLLMLKRSKKFNKTP